MAAHRIGMLVSAVLALACVTGAIAKSNDKDQGKSETVEGLVRDIACPIQNKEATATTFNLDCAIQCARRGSPLIILSKEGVIYIPISASMPDADRRQQLTPFVGKYVRATGKVYERSGTRAIVIEHITEMENVHLVTDAK